MIDYSWVRWMRELVSKIAVNSEDYLVERAKAVEWIGDNMALFQYGDENIDPLSFLYFLARYRSDEAFHSELRSVKEVFAIEAEYSENPGNMPCIPRPSGVNTLFHYDGKGRPDLVWRLFKQAAEAEPRISSSDFEDALQIKNVKIRKLTQTLFMVNPNHFLPADDTNRVLPWPEFQEKVKNYDEYVARMEAIRKNFPSCEPYEINSFLHMQRSNPLITSQSKFFQISTNVFDNGFDYWEWNNNKEEDISWFFKENNYVYTSGPGEGKPKPLSEPSRGDVILVRKGQHQGYAIGVVEDNQYRSGWTKEGVIYVHWINKTASWINLLSRQLSGFSRALEATRKGFRDADAYKISFDLIEQLKSSSEPSSPPIEDVDGPEEEQVDEDSSSSLSLNTILFGPPGTGKTYKSVPYAVAIVDGENPSELANSEKWADVRARFEELKGLEQIKFITFHQNYAYEDFVEGIRPNLKGIDLTYELRDGIFKQMSLSARSNPAKTYVLVIDEINRGNIAKIFGELITLIEPSKRLGKRDEAAVILPYSQDSFGVPQNLYLVGTMNTADRNIEPLDTALRRRFDFIEMMPNPDLVEQNIEDIDGRELLKAINRRIKAKLDREHQIGHTYLIGITAIDALAKAFQRRILPLLQEYFYDDWKKIRHILNYNPFIQNDPATPRDSDADRPMLELLSHDDERWRQAESYQKIYAADQEEPGN